MRGARAYGLGGLTASVAKMEIMCLKAKGAGNVSFIVTAVVGEGCNQTIEFLCSARAISKYSDLSGEIVRLVLRAWARFRRYNIKVNDLPGGSLAAEGVNAGTRGSWGRLCCTGASRSARATLTTISYGRYINPSLGADIPSVDRPLIQR